jgi:hypothetical protein
MSTEQKTPTPSRVLCAGDGTPGSECGHVGGQSGFACPQCGGMLLSETSLLQAKQTTIAWLDVAIKQRDSELAAKSAEVERLTNELGKAQLAADWEQPWKEKAQAILDSGRWAGFTLVQGLVTELEEARASIAVKDEALRKWPMVAIIPEQLEIEKASFRMMCKLTEEIGKIVGVDTENAEPPDLLEGVRQFAALCDRLGKELEKRGQHDVDCPRVNPWRVLAGADTTCTCDLGAILSERKGRRG